MYKNRTSIVLTLVLAITIALPLFALPTADAHVPAWTIPTYAYIVASPDPIGIGQTAFLVFWLDKVPPTAGGVGGDRWKGFTVTVTKPDSTTQTLGPFLSDATSAAWSLYTVDQLGTYRFTFNYPGQTASLYHPTSGIAGTASDYVNDTYLGSSASTTMVVQQNPVSAPPTYPLPSSFWTRPVEGQNTAWSSIMSNYLGGSSIIDKVQPNGAGPNSAHIMWTKPLQDGGIVGDDSNYWMPSNTYYSGLSYEGKFNNPIIMYGRLYYKAPLANQATGGSYICVDLTTGETLWENSAINPTIGQLYLYESMNQHGVIGDGYLWQTSGTTWMAYDARTGQPVFNMTDVPSGTEMRGPSGEITRYVLNYNTTTRVAWLALWNSSATPDGPLVLTAGNGTNAYQYRPYGKSANMSKSYTWNVTINGLPTGSSIRRVIPEDMMLGSTSSTVGGGFGFGSTTYYVWAISLKPNSRGQLLWNRTYQPPTGNMTQSFGPVDPVNRVYTMTLKETMQWIGFNLDTGEQMWGPTGDFRPFQYYGTVSNPPAPGYVYDGKMFVGGYGGEILAFDTKTGNTIWRYNDTYSGVETPWGYYPIFIATIADGKVYAYSSEHSPNNPPYKGSKVRCIDADTGKEIWTLLSWYAIGSFGQGNAPVADGYLTYFNIYDMQVYCIGKGPSAISVEAPLTAITQGQSLMIQGKVTDDTSSSEAKGTPAISEESMSDWMAYIYMQKPIPANATGVTVKLSAMDSNGNVVNIGTVTSDMSGLYKKMWTPPTAGEYTIVASFEGSNSYWPSYAETAVGVVAAQTSPAPTVAPTSTVTPTVAPTTTASPSPVPNTGDGIATEVYIGIAAVAVIAIVAAAALILRKRS
jgi:outer membrane protein assembly factor BamB